MRATMTRNGERFRMTIVRDIRDRLAAQDRILHLAHHDALTGLPNRMSLMERLEHLIADARRNDSQLALLFIDLDHFKRVNDSLGHLVGDTLLQTIARRITECPALDRPGGALRRRRIHRAAAVDAAARATSRRSPKLLAAIEVPVNGRRPADLGHAVDRHLDVPARRARRPTQLIKNADTAMYLAKSRGRANYQFFTPEMARSALRCAGDGKPDGPGRSRAASSCCTSSRR